MCAASQARPVLPDDLYSLRFIQSAALSPDSSQVIFTVSSYDVDADEDYTHIWLHDIETEQSRQLTFGAHNNTQPQWAPDGVTIAFLSTRGEMPQIYRMRVDGGEAQALTHVPHGVASGPKWSPGGSRIAFCAKPEPQEGESEFDTTKPYRVRRHVYRFDRMGYLDGAVQNIYQLEVESGQVHQLTDGPTVDSNPHWSPDGMRILYGAMMKSDQHSAAFPHPRVVNPSGKVVELLAGWGDVRQMAWHPEGEGIVFVGTPAGKPIGSKADLYVTPLNGKENPQNRTASLPNGVGGSLQGDMPLQGLFNGPILVTADGQSAIVQVQNGGTIGIYSVALQGDETHRELLGGPRACVPLDLKKQGQLLYVTSNINETPNLALASLPTVEDAEADTTARDAPDRDAAATEAATMAHEAQPIVQEQQITDLNAGICFAEFLPTVERLRFESPDGVQVEGWFIAPRGGKPPYPTVLYIHGGPHSAFGHIYHFDTQMLVGAGYGVLMVNHRASTGYGDEFATAIKGDWGNLDYLDLMAGVDTVIEQGWADPDRLGVCGLSGGGNLSCWIVGQTDRFKAAVPENPVTNWQSFYGTSDIGVWFSVEELGGHPHQIPDVYVRCSPITHAHRCTTPTLLIQCEHDWRCPIEQGEQFYNVLKANGCTVEMLRLPGGSHGGTIDGSPPLRRAQNEALLEWMNRYVGR